MRRRPELRAPGTTQAPTTDAPTMRAVVQDAYGDADVLRQALIPRPEITEDEVLVRVRLRVLTMAPGT